MKDLIDRAELQAAFEKECIGECEFCKHIKHNPEGCALIDNAPPVDAVKVVRCNECRYYETDTGFCQYHGHGMHWDDFCSRGAKIDE